MFKMQSRLQRKFAATFAVAVAAFLIAESRSLAAEYLIQPKDKKFPLAPVTLFYKSQPVRVELATGTITNESMPESLELAVTFNSVPVGYSIAKPLIIRQDYVFKALKSDAKARLRQVRDLLLSGLGVKSSAFIFSNLQVVCDREVAPMPSDSDPSRRIVEFDLDDNCRNVGTHMGVVLH